MKSNEYIDIVNERPKLKGYNVRVEDIVYYYEDCCWNAERISDELEIPLSRVHNSLAYYYENVKDIREQMKNDDKFVELYKKRYEENHLKSY